MQDGSGNISSGELLLVMRALGKNPTEDEVLNLLMKADVDGNGTIDFEEFVKMMKTEVSTENSALDFTYNPPSLIMATFVYLTLIFSRSSDIFSIFDRDSDGLVSREDVRSVTLNLGTILSDRELDGFMRLGGKVNCYIYINVCFDLCREKMRRLISVNWR